MGEVAEPKREMKVVLFPFIAFGHMMPAYEFGLALAKSGIQVYYISTPGNLQRLPKVPQNLSTHFHLVPLPFQIIPNSPLPDGAEATVDVSAMLVPDLIRAFDLLKQPLKEYLTRLSPDWLIMDFLAHFSADVAKECGVPLMAFSPFSTAAKVFFGPPECLIGEGQVRSKQEDLTTPPPWVNFPSQVAYRPFEADFALHYTFFNNEAYVESSTAGRFAIGLRESKCIAIRTCKEIEGKYLALLGELLGKPVIPVGFLSPEIPKQRDFADENWTKIFNWLDEQRDKSVVFAGFGTECKLSKEQLAEIANGLEQSDLPFLWALRKPSWAIDDSDALPAGFADRIAGRGKVCVGWAPQFQILAHPAIGGSLFHAGWGSAIETLQFGHAMVVLPFIIDQGLNARLLVEKGLAIEVERNQEDGSFTGKDIAKCLKQAMAAEKMGERVREMAAVAGDRKLHDGYMEEFVKYLINASRFHSS